MAFKKKSSALKHRPSAPTLAQLERLSRQIQKLSEQVGLSESGATAS